MKSCQVITSDKSNLLRKIYCLLKSGFQVIAFCIPFGVGCLVIIAVNFVYKWAQQLFSGDKKCLIGLYLWNFFPIGGLKWSRGFTIFQSRIPKWLLSNSKAVNTCKDKTRKQVVAVLK